MSDRQSALWDRECEEPDNLDCHCPPCYSRRRLWGASQEMAEALLHMTGEGRCSICWDRFKDLGKKLRAIGEPAPFDALDASLEGEWTGRGNERTEAHQ